MSEPQHPPGAIRSTPLLGLLPERHAPALSAAGQVRLLDLTFARHRFGISIMPAVAGPLVWFYARSHDAAWLAVWAALFLLFALGMVPVHRRFARDLEQLDPDALLDRWRSRIQGIAWLHGGGLSLAVVLTAPHATYEFELLLYVAIAAITAANATHQNPSLSVFMRFFMSGWGVCVALSVWAFPAHWQYVTPLCVLFGLAVYRDALGTQRVFAELVRLEEQARQLIDDLQRARDEAHNALQEKSRFLSTASHDLRQPVHAMSLLVEAVNRRSTDPAVSPLLADLKTSMEALNQMFSALLDLSRLEAGGLAGRTVTVSLRPLLADILPLFREQARHQGLSLRLRLPPGDAFARTDPALLQRAVVNLVHNALRYTERGGVLVSLRPRHDHWRIAVWDTGVGIATEDGSRIFSPYFRNHHAWRIDGAGHGLGLSVVERSARLMGATLDFRSQLGRGSCFWIDLPRERPGDVPPPLAARDAGCTLSGRCLVLDDDPRVVAAWSALLTTWGIDARVATNAMEAMAALETGFEPQAILCDLRLRAGESGFDVLRDLLERCPYAAGALVSGEFDSPELRQAADEGYVVLRKPLDPSQLHGLMSAWLASGPAQPTSPST